MLKVVGFEREVEERIVKELQGNDKAGENKDYYEFQVTEDGMDAVKWIPGPRCKTRGACEHIGFDGV